MKFKKIIPVLLSMAFCISSTLLPALPAGAASHNGSGTAGINVTVTVGEADDGSMGGQMPDDGGTGNKIPSGGTGTQTPSSSGGDNANPGQDGGGSAADTGRDKDSNGCGNADKDKDKDKGKGSDRNKGKDKNKDSDGNKKGGKGEKGTDDGSGSSGRDAGGQPSRKNPPGQPAALPAAGYPADGESAPHSSLRLNKDSDDGDGGRTGDGGIWKDTSGCTDEQKDAGESGNADIESGESGGTGDGKSEINERMAWRYWKQAVLAALALAAVAPAVFFARRRIRFHGVLADKNTDGVLFRGNTDSANGAAAVAELIGKLNEGSISFDEYEDMIMESRSVTLFPSGTKMAISVTDDGMAETWPAEKADESRMYDRLREAAALAHRKDRTVMADVLLKHSRKGIEIPMHFVFR